MAGLYLHIPFCQRKCAYCDFTSYAEGTGQWGAIAAAMAREMDRARGLAVATVFVGGGTPTLLPAKALAGLLDAVRDRFVLDPDAEITVEANPGTVDAAKLAALREAGVNRLSLGAQAMQPRLLEALGRIHRWEQVASAVRDARDAGFTNINLDLMYGLPGQTPSDMRATLEAALSLEPRHLSAYSLIIEPGTPFFGRYNDHPELLPCEDAVAEMADDVLWMAEDAGLLRYEISNYAQPGFECLHNLGCWRRGDYLGVGVGAHSLLDNHRWANSRSIAGYLAGGREEETVLTAAEARFERLMLGLRLVDGIPWGGQDLYDHYKDRLRILREKGLLDWDHQRLWLTRRGLDLQNRVLGILMES